MMPDVLPTASGALAIGLFMGLLPLAPAMAQDRADVDRALAIVRQRATAGDAVAQFTLGSHLYYGTPNTADAVDWIRRAAAQGLPDAEYHVGQLHEYGFGVAQDNDAALSWYRKAAEHGSAAAARAVGDFFLRGRGVTANAAEAARWYARGAAGDDIRAQYQLGQLYLDGNGVARDNVSAYVWFTRAASQAPLIDNRKALVEFANVADARMTPEQQSEARRRVKDASVK